MKTKKPNIRSRASGRSASVSRQPTSLLLGLLRSAVISLGCGLLLLLLLCAVLLSTDNPGAYAQTAGMILPFPAAVLCGILAAKQTSLGGLPAGLLGGAVLCLSLFALGAVLPNGSTAAVPSILNIPVRIGICLLLSGIGGYCVTHKKPKSRKPRLK